MTKHRFTPLAIAAAVALSLPASASAKPVYDNGIAGASPQEVRTDGANLMLPLAGGSLVLVVAGIGLVRYRIRSASVPAAIGGRPAAV